MDYSLIGFHASDPKVNTVWLESPDTHLYVITSFHLVDCRAMSPVLPECLSGDDDDDDDYG